MVNNEGWGDVASETAVMELDWDARPGRPTRESAPRRHAHLLDVAIERRWYVSFAGNASFPKAVDLRLAATQVPADMILAETDCPYLAPQPVRGKRNEPAYVPQVAAEIARLRGVPLEEIATATTSNFFRLFGIERA